MKVLLIGSGGREHALAYKIKESKSLDKLFIMPGNPGTEILGVNVQGDIDDGAFILNFCKDEKIDLVVIGPEKPLVDGLADLLRENNISVFGPNKRAAEIEAHKSFAKNLMEKYDIPSASYKEFSTEMIEEANQYIATKNYPLVIKADGLAAGKGVLICNNYEEANAALDDLFVKKIFGKAGEKIIIEEFLLGLEASIFAITDGEDFICLPAAQDHKRIGNNDEGKNTGGMGAYSPAPLVTDSILEQVKETIIRPTLSALRNEGRKFNGCLYCGIMVYNDAASVVEFNCRFGDPETQSVMTLLDGDFLSLLYSAAKGKIDKTAVRYNGGSSVCVVAASKGYPDEYESGYVITGLDEANKEAVVFHAGTKQQGEKILTKGGRVLSVTSFIPNNDLSKAKEKAYYALNKIHFDNIYYRTDISDKA
ncbi:MAG TPA: phosphoribosylamine--glycine ligase [Ignavibacteriaceae bacterium]|nr:phosphoribosylamine--glycine ligase [Ignavibacteriaceae bacterium]